jgi:hypothetical protein
MICYKQLLGNSLNEFVSICNVDPYVFAFVQSVNVLTFSRVFLCYELSVCLTRTVAVHGDKGFDSPELWSADNNPSLIHMHHILTRFIFKCTTNNCTPNHMLAYPCMHSLHTL